MSEMTVERWAAEWRRARACLSEGICPVCASPLTPVSGQGPICLNPAHRPVQFHTCGPDIPEETALVTELYLDVRQRIQRCEACGVLR
jgi:hypothetical protein